MLFVASPEMFRQRFNIEVNTDTEVTGIDRRACVIGVRDLRSGARRSERYDALVLSPGAAPIRPPLPGIDLEGVFAIRNIPDSRRIRSWISDRRTKTAVVVGGGFIGLEMVENLIHRSLAVTVLEKLAQVMPPPAGPGDGGTHQGPSRSAGRDPSPGRRVGGYRRGPWG